MRHPLSRLLTARWPWLAMSALVCVAAAGFILLLQNREHEARANEAIVQQFAGGMPIGNAESASDFVPLIATLTREQPDLLDKLLRRQLALLKGQLGAVELIDPARGAEIRAALDRAEQAPKGEILASGLQFSKAAKIARRVADGQAARVERAERDSLAGNLGALTFATLLVAILLSRERRLTLRAARHHAQEIQLLADHDGLTGLLNRRRFDEALQALPKGDPGEVEIAICDVNGLKSINDRFGHHAGDAVLVTATQDLHSALGDAGTVYRTGGDEFSIIGRPGERVANLARQAFERDGIIVASVGAATWPTDNAIAREVVRLADNRMYDAKRAIDGSAVVAATPEQV